jgi:hypothetical protein
MFAVQAEVDWMLTIGADFAEIENYIEERVALSEDLKSVLWLYGWAETRRQQRATPTICTIFPAIWPKAEGQA